MKKITLEQYLTSSGKYPDRATSHELNMELIRNANILLDKVNEFLEELGISEVTLSSGFRPTDVNAATPNAAKKSNHCICVAMDIEDDKDQTLGHLILSNPELLRKYGLFVEDLASTIGQNTNWTHLDYMERTDRPSRSFKP